MTRRVRGSAPDPPPAPRDVEMRRWGLDPEWSRFVDVPGHDGVTRRWHVLDTGATVASPGDTSRPTLVCVHGNPTWSVLWASFLHRFGDRHRVVAPDQLGMGYSERTPSPRTYAHRVADLDDLLRAADVSGPVVLAAHDWGGAIAMGWAVAHARRRTVDVDLVAMVLANTGIAVPQGRSAPAIIRLAAAPGVHHLATRRTPLFVRGTGWLSRDRVTRTDRQALAAPYRRAVDRRAIGDFVGDIPFSPAHPSAAAIDATATALGDLDVPVLLAWGGRDPVFDDDFAADLLARFRDVDLHRFPTAGHLVVLESTGDAVPGPSVAEVADEWIAARVHPGAVSRAGAESASDAASSRPHRPVWAAIDERGDGADAATVAFHDGATGRSVTFGELRRMIAAIAAGLRQRRVRHGDRVALLVPPSVELVALVYACWRIGAVTVIADRGLGLAGLGRAVRGARVQTVIGPRRALVAARALRWAPSAATIDLADVVAMAASRDPVTLPDTPSADDLAAVLFTSGATGPAKGVRYTHAGLAGQRDALAALYAIGPSDRFVAAFAPFALYGPALGIASAIPDVDVTTPGALTAAALDRACAAVDATMVFASPAALANVVGTADGPLPALARVRTVMSAGAPVPIRTLRAVAALAPAAALHTPYGMTEALPVADIDLAGIESAVGVARAGDDGAGVCVGHPVAGCDVMIVALGGDAAAPLPVGRTGEVFVRSPWMSAGYDGLWRTEHDARPVDADGRRWHRSGDVGHVDLEGRLWIEGRLVHVVHTVHGPVTPVPVEVAAETLADVRRAAAVGVGPVGIQQLVVVVETDREGDRAGDGLADVDLTARVRDAVAPQVVAAVCTRAALPVDIRHNAKIDRGEVASWATRLLAGGTP